MNIIDNLIDAVDVTGSGAARAKEAAIAKEMAAPIDPKNNPVQSAGGGTTFVDNSGDNQSIASTVRDMPVPPAEHDIYQFLAEPVRIAAFSWLAGTEPADFNPWELWFTNAAVKRKLANYHLISCKLKLKVVTNGNSFQYGLAHYGYLPATGSIDVFRTQANGLGGYSISSLPLNFTIDPSSDSVIELEVPWHFISEWQVANAVGTSVGTAPNFVSFVPAPLLSASAGVLAPGVDITIFASAIDVKLQFKSNYVAASDYKGMLSKPLNTASNIASMFTNVPVIGKYATAAKTAASGMASLATVFGFSAPNLLESHPTALIKTTGNLASTVNVDTGDVLATDPRAETIIDPRLFGLHGKDEMVISELTSRYSLTNIRTWTNAQGLDTIVFTLPVSPHVNDFDFPMAPSHLSYHTMPFNFYRGSIKFKIVIPVSKFHTGRLQFWYEPEAATSTAIDPTNTTMNLVYDLSAHNEIVMEIPYASRVLTGTRNGFSSIAQLITQTTIGQLRAKVISALRCGGVATTVSILVYVASGDDWELMCPDLSFMFGNNYRYAYFPGEGALPPPAFTALDGYILNESSPATDIVDTPLIDIKQQGSIAISDQFSSMAASERVLSYRSLVKRFSVRDTVVLPRIQYGSCGRITHTNPHPPMISKTNSTTYVNTEMPSFMNYLQPCYSFYRGGTRHKFIDLYDMTSSLFATRWHRREGEDKAFALTSTGPIVTTNNFHDFVNGASLNADASKRALEITVPWYYDRIYKGALEATSSDATNRCFLLGATKNNSTSANPLILHLSAAGDDFSYYFYIAPPTIFKISLI